MAQQAGGRARVQGVTQPGLPGAGRGPGPGRGDWPATQTMPAGLLRPLADRVRLQRGLSVTRREALTPSRSGPGRAAAGPVMAAQSLERNMLVMRTAITMTRIAQADRAAQA